MKLQDKLQEIQNEVCLRITGVYWSQLLITFADGKITHQQVRDVQKEVSIAFAAYCCERQRESDAEANRAYHVDKGNSYNHYIVLNNKLITDNHERNYHL